jgi:hypothetical protein
VIDANFRLKNKERNIDNDMPLGDGWGCWVKSEPYKDHVAMYGHQEEVSYICLCRTASNLSL